MTFFELIQSICDDLFINTTDSEIPRIKRFLNRGYKELIKRQKYAEYKIELYWDIFEKPSYCKKSIQLQQGDTAVDYTETITTITTAATGLLLFIYEIDYNLVPDLVDNDDVPITDPQNNEFILEYAKALWYSKENKKEYKAEIHVRNYENMKIKKPKIFLSFSVER